MTRDGRPPWFPFYPEDFCSDSIVELMSTEAVGAFILLLCKAWRQTPAGSLPDDDSILSRWSRLSADRWIAIRPQVMAAFTLGTDLRWHQKRMRLVFDEFAARRKKKSSAGSLGATAKWGQTDGQKNRSKRLADSRKLGRHTPADWQTLKETFGFRCLMCGRNSPEVELVRDHIIPVYQGGSDGIDNIQPLCRSCNASKGPESTDLRKQQPEWSAWQTHGKRLAEHMANACPTPTPTPTEKKTPLPPLPECLDTPAFRKAWDEYLRHRREIRARKLSPAGTTKQWSKMAEWGVDAAIQAIDATIANGWTGVFAPKDDGKPASTNCSENRLHSGDPDGIAAAKKDEAAWNAEHREAFDRIPKAEREKLVAAVVERLPKPLPDWFVAEKDSNLISQVNKKFYTEKRAATGRASGRT